MKSCRKRKRAIILDLAIVFALVYVAVSFVQLQVKIGETNERCDEVASAYEKQNFENQELQRLLDSGDEQEYMERIARDQLGYVKPDEKVFYDVAGN